MDSTELILKLIREKYESIRQFAIMADIPYSTVKSGLRAGIQGITVETVFKMCYVLQIRVDSLFPRNAGPEENGQLSAEECYLLGKHRSLSAQSKQEVMHYVEY